MMFNRNGHLDHEREAERRCNTGQHQCRMRRIRLIQAAELGFKESLITAGPMMSNNMKGDT